MTSEELENEVDKIYPDVIREAFGQAINGLWGWHPQLTPILQKEGFFYLLERLLREGKVLLTPPPLFDDREPFYYLIADGNLDTALKKPATRTDKDEPNRFTIWDVSVETQIKYLRSVFPDVSDSFYLTKINLFWFMGLCPWIAWRHPTTQVLYAS